MKAFRNSEWFWPVLLGLLSGGLNEIFLLTKVGAVPSICALAAVWTAFLFGFENGKDMMRDVWGLPTPRTRRMTKKEEAEEASIRG